MKIELKLSIDRLIILQEIRLSDTSRLLAVNHASGRTLINALLRKTEKEIKEVSERINTLINEI